MGKLQLWKDLNHPKVHIGSRDVIGNNSWLKKGEEDLIAWLDKDGATIEGFENAHELLYFATSATLITKSQLFLSHLLKTKKPYRGDVISTAWVDKIVSKISAVRSQSKDEGNRSTMQATINLLLSETYSIVMVGTEPKRCTIKELCKLKDKHWQPNHEEGLIERLKQGAVVLPKISNDQSLLHFSVKRAIESGSSKLLKYTLNTYEDATYLTEMNNLSQTPLQVLARHSTMIPRGLLTEIADLLMDSKPCKLNMTYYSHTLCDEETTTLSDYLIHKLDFKDLVKEVRKDCSWYSGCEQELVRRMRGDEQLRTSKDVQLDKSLLHFATDKALYSGSTELLRFALENIYLDEDSISKDFDNKGRTIIQRIKNTECNRHHKSVCLRSIVIYDHLDIYMVDETGHGLSQYENTKYKKANVFMKTMQRVQEFCEFRRQLGSSNEVRNEVEKRMQLAFEHIADSSSSSVKFIHRSKDFSYFKDILLADGAARYKLPRTPKRDWGSIRNEDLKHYGCPLNEIMFGTFWVCNDEEAMGLEPNRSPFGDTRLMKPVKTMLTKPELNFYFADFYCITFGQRHYILIAMAKQGTMEDTFCERYLFKIDPSDNKFFSINQDGTATCLDKAWVFLFCMDEVKMDNTLSLKKINDQEEIDKSFSQGEEHLKAVERVRPRTIIKRNGEIYTVRKRRIHDTCRICTLARQNSSLRCHIHAGSHPGPHPGRRDQY